MNITPLKRKLLIITTTVVFLILICVVLLMNKMLADKKYTYELRNHVFCEEIQPGMSPRDAEQVLLSYGEYTKSEDTEGDIYIMDIRYKDRKVDYKFGKKWITLRFYKGQYINALLPVPMKDYYQNICPWPK
jgi:hypothetical protein